MIISKSKMMVFFTEVYNISGPNFHEAWVHPLELICDIWGLLRPLIVKSWMTLKWSAISKMPSNNCYKSFQSTLIRMDWRIDHMSHETKSCRYSVDMHYLNCKLVTTPTLSSASFALHFHLADIIPNYSQFGIRLFFNHYIGQTHSKRSSDYKNRTSDIIRLDLDPSIPTPQLLYHQAKSMGINSLVA